VWVRRDYLHREAIPGRDMRGGGMALLFATEMAALRFRDACGRELAHILMLH
jgi:hypothetical protein